MQMGHQCVNQRELKRGLQWQQSWRMLSKMASPVHLLPSKVDLVEGQGQGQKLSAEAEAEVEKDSEMMDVDLDVKAGREQHKTKREVGDTPEKNMASASQRTNCYICIC
jgi:hypothetical protein